MQGTIGTQGLTGTQGFGYAQLQGTQGTQGVQGLTYSAPTIGITPINSGATVTTLQSVTLQTTTLIGTVTAAGTTGTSGQFLQSTNSGVQWLYVNSIGTTGIAGTDTTWNQTATAPTTTGRVNYEGYLYATRVYNAVFNDYAEYFLKEDLSLEPGDVVSVGTTGYVKSHGDSDKLVVGVYSDDYGQCLGGRGDGTDEDNYVSVGMAGRVRVKVVGDVAVGDLLVPSSIPGVARSGAVVGCILGKALESHSGNSTDRIFALILNG